MLRTRVIPVLLFSNSGLVKSINFKNYTYVGDPLNAVKIFNEKEVDEIIFLDIDASAKKLEPNFTLIESLATECFMPFCYGGGITSIEQIQKIFSLGAEKVSLNTAARKTPELIKEAVELFGSQSIVATVDIKRNFFGKQLVYDHIQKKTLKISLVDHIKYLESLGVGEIMINDVDKDGMLSGYDLEMLSEARLGCKVPLIACGGAGSLEDFKKAKEIANVSAVAAGSFFVFQGKHKAVLITYPNYQILEDLFGEH